MAKVSPKVKENVTPVVENQPLVSKIAATPKEEKVAALPFGRANYQFMVAGILVILVGFFVMSLDKEEFGFGFLGLTLGPLIVLSGFVLEIFAILKKPTVK